MLNKSNWLGWVHLPSEEHFSCHNLAWVIFIETGFSSQPQCLSLYWLLAFILRQTLLNLNMICCIYFECQYTVYYPKKKKYKLLNCVSSLLGTMSDSRDCYNNYDSCHVLNWAPECSKPVITPWWLMGPLRNFIWPTVKILTSYWDVIHLPYNSPI